jgi:hypothetical protein
MTRIFKDYAAFLKRKDKKENGVSQYFVDNNEKWEQMNETNEACWDCSDCSDCSGCSRCSGCSGCLGCSDCSGCSRCSRCSGCSGCLDCSGCSGCSGCSDCSDCSRCSRCSGCSGCLDCSDCSRCYYKNGIKGVKPEKTPIGEAPATGFPDVPVIENIHQKVYEASSQPNALNMSDWHTCETTHCRAGWVEFLAGEAGKNLFDKTKDHVFTGMQIYKASSPIRVSPVRFFESNEEAMADMKRCAEEEKALAETK